MFASFTISFTDAVKYYMSRGRDGGREALALMG